MPSAARRRRDVTVHSWLGLRYARAPRRFAAPEPDDGRLEVQRLGEVPIFPQRRGRLSDSMGDGSSNPQSEDAFFLNVWAPAQADVLPVLVFIHGGAWMTGAGAKEWYDGGALAAEGLVVVTVNYRIGVLGHLGRADVHDLPLPAADLLLALRWVERNIASYGGDPGRTTLVGHSAGGWYGHLLSVLPQTRGLVHRVAHLSMPTRMPWTVARQREVTEAVEAALGGDRASHAAIDELIDAGARALSGGPPPSLAHVPAGFLPVASRALPSRLLDPEWSATACHAQAVYLRSTADESAAFFFRSRRHLEATQEQVDEALEGWAAADLPPQLKRGDAYSGKTSGVSPYRQLVAASSWRQFQRFASEYAAALTAAGRESQLTVFTGESPLPDLRSAHCFDLPFQFGHRGAWSDAPMMQGVGRERFATLSTRLIAEIVDFVKG